MTVLTRKFSQFNNGGNLNNGATTVGLQSSANAFFNNPWVFLPPGPTATRPVTPIIGQLRFNTDLTAYEYWNGSIWVQLSLSPVANEIWQNITTTPFNLVQDNNYLANAVARIFFVLPTTAVFGEEIKVAGVFGQGGWRIVQNAGQSIIVDNVQTTVGATGYIESVAETQVIQLVNIVPNLTWIATSVVGSVTIV